MKLFAKLLVVGATLAATNLLCAKTVAWYHFDEGADGQRSAGGTPQMLNAADPSRLPGRPYAMLANSLSMVTTGKLLPVYTNVFPVGVTWRDPATGIKGTNRRGLFLDSLNHDGSGQAGVVLVDDDEKLHLQKFTVELMVKFCGDRGLLNWSHICMMRNGPGNSKAWGLHINKAGTVSLQMSHFSEPSETGAVTTNSLSWTTGSGSHANLVDGKWHHLALTYDGRYARLYVDYALPEGATRTWTYGLSYSPAREGRLCIGGNDKATYGRWLGFVDEVRISDEVLSPSQFLRPGGCSEKAAALTDEETALYLSFDHAEVVTDTFFGTVDRPMVYNESVATMALPLTVGSIDGIFPTAPATGGVSPVLNGGLFSTAGVDNGGYWLFGTGDIRGRSIHMTLDDYSKNDNTHLISSGNFTIEYWFKSSTVPSGTMYLVCEQSGTKKAGTMLLYVNKNNEMFCRLASQSEYEAYEATGDSISFNDAFKAGICDGQWHHVALVVDRSQKYAAFFVDYQLVREHKNFVLASGLTGGATTKPLQISGGYGAYDRADQFYDMAIDELRITCRALTPAEFLKMGAPGTEALEPTRFHAGFEGTYAAGPRADETSLIETPAGTHPTFSRLVPGNTIVDGEGAVLKVDNTNSVVFAANGRFGRIHYSRNILLEREMYEQTVEFFMRAEEGAFRAWSHLLHHGLGYAYGGVNVWSVGYCSAGDDGFSVRVDTDLGGMAMGEPGFNQVVYAKNIHPADGKWHHIAITFALHEKTNTLVRIYKDYAEVGSKVVNGRLKMPTTATSLNIGMAENANYFYEGLLDEVRISKGVLPVEKFMRAVWVGGPTHLFVR